MRPWPAQAADEIARRPPLAGPRVLLAGAPVDGTALHSAIESRGAIVVSEVGPWGNGAAGADVVCDDDPIDCARGQVLRGRDRPADAGRASFKVRSRDLLDDVDAVVVSLPAEDTAFGWDYPAFRESCENERDSTHLFVAAIPAAPCLLRMKNGSTR